ncbi:MAG: hypothetical protein P4L90_20970 [Rhodopila sp.]|nr:hypothetical protein [Rhodopila sp.]
MALVAAIVLGGIAGAVVETGKRNLIKSWSKRDQLPPVIKLLVVAILIGTPVVNAGTFSNYVSTALATVGAFTVARWSVASVIVLWHWRR